MKRNFYFFSLIVLLLLPAASATFPIPAHAQEFSIVNDPDDIVQNTVTAGATGATAGSTFTTAITSINTLLKNTTLDPLAWMLAKTVLQSIVKSTVNSVNKGPNGTPAFTTNLNSTLQAVADTAANSFISQLSSNGSINSPFRTAVAANTGSQYAQATGNSSYFSQNAYTLNQVTSNDTAFFNGNLNQGGGLNAWMSAWSNPQNNPFGASMLASNGAASQASNAKSVQSAELNWGQGFASSRGACNTTTTGGLIKAATSAAGLSGAAGTAVSTALTSLSPNSGCQSNPINSPGSTIKTSLDKALGSGIDTLVSAKSFDEIVNALLAQLINQVTSPNGLAGVSQPQPVTTPGATPAPTYFDQTDSSQTAASVALSNNFNATLSGQLSSLQTYQTQWTSINNAAQAANTALSTSTCYPNAQATITNTVQPVINQATTALAQASSGISSLTNIQAEAAQSSAATSLTGVSQASIDYSTLQQSNVLPTLSGYTNAATQSAATGTPPTLFMQMTKITQAAQACAAGQLPTNTI